MHNCSSAITSSVEWVKPCVRVYAATNRWREVEMMCEKLVKFAPNDPFTIFNKAEALHRQGRSRDAYDTMWHMQASFRKIPQFFYDSARYLCGIGEGERASSYLRKAFDLDKDLRLRALNDPDLGA